MSCEFIEQVSLLIDGELPPNDVSRVERHAATCGECQSARADFLNMRRQIAEYHVSLDPLAQQRALAEILSGRNRETVSRSMGPGWRERLAAAFRRPNFGVAMAAACALLLMIGFAGVMMYRNSHREANIVEVQTPSFTPAPQTSPDKSSPDSGKQVRSEAPIETNSIPTYAANIPSRGPRPAMLRQPQAENNANIVQVNATDTERITSADAETLTARHVEQASLLLRSFRNTRPEDNPDISYEKGRARQLLYQNILLRREATNSGNVQVATLLDSLEPVLIDMANMPARPSREQVQTLNQRMERKNLVPLLQISSNELAKAFD